MAAARGLKVLDRRDRSLDVIEGGMLAQVDPGNVGLLHEMLAACAHSLEATRPRRPL